MGTKISQNRDITPTSANQDFTDAITFRAIIHMINEETDYQFINITPHQNTHVVSLSLTITMRTISENSIIRYHHGLI